VLILAERIKLLFGFMADLIPDKDLIHKAAGNLSQMQNNALTLAPLLTVSVNPKFKLVRAE